MTVCASDGLHRVRSLSQEVPSGEAGRAVLPEQAGVGRAVHILQGVHPGAGRQRHEPFFVFVFILKALTVTQHAVAVSVALSRRHIWQLPPAFSTGDRQSMLCSDGAAICLARVWAKPVGCCGLCWRLLLPKLQANQRPLPTGEKMRYHVPQPTKDEKLCRFAC